ncbi:MAG: TonB-dependent receptor [Terriglobales bacterium]
MRSALAVFFALCFSLLFSVAASAVDLKVRVLDPQSAAVAGAQVSLLRASELTVLATESTSAEGFATFHIPSAGSYKVRVLAPGFAAESLEVPSDISSRDQLTVNLRLATASETVVVTATRTPVPGEAAGADVDNLSATQLTAMQPATAADAIRFLSGAAIDTNGQRGGLSSLFVRGGESTYNKVIVDGVAVDNPGLTFDFGTLPLTEVDRLELALGAQSTLYGSDAMTSVVQVWTRTGSTAVPELRFGADGGNFGTANGYASLSGLFRRFDYNFFGDQFETNGQGINNHYSNSLQGANAGVALTNQVSLRVRFRHSNTYTGVPGEWNFNGYDPPVIPPTGPTEPIEPDPSERSRQNNLLGSVELAVNSPFGWQHRFTAFDSLYRYNDTNLSSSPYVYDSFPDSYTTHDNRAGFEYQGDYSERSWTHSTFGYRIENENGFVNDLDFPPAASGQRLQQDGYFQQQATLGRLSAIAGGRFVHNSAYGNRGVPRISLTLLALRGGRVFSGTRLRFSYATGFMTPALYEVFGEPGVGYAPNKNLLPERTRAFEAGFEQKFLAGRWALAATYFNNLFRDQIEAIPTPTGEYQFFNLNQSFAQGAEFRAQGRIASRLSLNAAYTYTSTEVLANQTCTLGVSCAPYAPGDPLLHRPKHAGTVLLDYLGTRWGGNLSGSFVGRRPDYDFPFNDLPYGGSDFAFTTDHAAGYALVNLGGWYAINSRVTAYVNFGNALNAHYNEVVGYPALTANFRAGFRFRIGGENRKAVVSDRSSVITH